jgi:hypothetical protein
MNEAGNEDWQPAAAWREFVTQPISYTSGSRLAACFKGSLEVGFCQQLSASPRLRDKLSAVIAAHYALPDWKENEAVDEADRAIALSSPDHIREVAHRAGAIYWAGTISGAILAHEVEVFHKHLGRDLCAFALVNRDLAGPRQEVDASGNLGNWVMADGWRCLEAWRRSLPESIAKRILLKLEPNNLLDMPPGRTFAELGPAIVRRSAKMRSAHG